MDRINFSESLGIDTETQVSKIFDEVMVMYNLVGEYKTVTNGTLKDDGSITFEVSFENTQEAIEASKVLWADCIRIGDGMYTLSNNTKKTKLIVNMNKLK